MKRSELYVLRANLNTVIAAAKGVKLSYALIRSLKGVEKELQIMEALQKPSEAFQLFDRERLGLCEEHSNKDDKGKAKTVAGQGGRDEYDIADRKAFDAAIEALRAKHKPALDEQETRIKGFMSFLDEEADVTLYKIKYSVYEAEQQALPVADRLAAGKLLLIWNLIEDDSEGEAAPAPAVEEIGKRQGFSKIKPE